MKFKLPTNLILYDEEPNRPRRWSYVYRNTRNLVLRSCRGRMWNSDTCDHLGGRDFRINNCYKHL